jgi:hypothetical protein
MDEEERAALLKELNRVEGKIKCLLEELRRLQEDYSIPAILRRMENDQEKESGNESDCQRHDG